jgi:hypothetical protein
MQSSTTALRQDEGGCMQSRSDAVGHRNVLTDRSWPAGAPVAEIDATLLTFKIRSDRPVWGKHF